VVDLPNSGRLVLPFDVGDLQENFDHEILPGETCDDAAALASLRRIRDLAAAPRSQCLLFHDPVAIQRMRLCPEAWD
jgi:N-acyl homoserine lactone hydrolase